MNKEKLKKHVITCKEYPNMTISAEVLGLILEALLEEDKEEYKPNYGKAVAQQYMEDTKIKKTVEAISYTIAEKMKDYTAEIKPITEAKSESKEEDKENDVFFHNINKMKEAIKEQPQHKPTEENLGWTIYASGEIREAEYMDFALECYKNNNWFPTREKAEQEREKRQAIARVKEYIAENNLNAKVYYHIDDEELTMEQYDKFEEDCKEDLETIYK